MTGVPPAPAIAAVPLPWDGPVADPVAALAGARAELGDTFMDASGRYLFLFSPEGVRSFYALPEERASKGVADFTMLRRKVPDELFAGRRTLPHELFGRDDVASYLANLDWALDVAAVELGPRGELDVFAHARRLGHRLGLASWAGRRSADGERFDRLVVALDALDAADAFVHPDLMGAVPRDDKAAEQAALADATVALGETLDEHDRAGLEHDGLFGRIVARWDGSRRTSAASGWPGTSCCCTSRRCRTCSPGSAGRSSSCWPDRTWWSGCGPVTARWPRRARWSPSGCTSARSCCAACSQPVVVDDGIHRLAVEPGVTIATLLPLTNLTAAPGLDRWDESRWAGRRLRDAADLPAPELVTAFGHGKHTCPAQPFSLAAITRAVTHLLDRFELVAGYDDPRPVPAQIGGVARSADPCPVRYAARDRPL